MSLLSLIFINTIFYRLAEHGTDRSALVLIFILAIYYLEGTNKKLTAINFNYYYQRILIITLLIASLKLLSNLHNIYIDSIFEFRNILLKKIFFKNYFFKSGILFLFGVLILIFTNFSNTGCFIYPASFTCLESFSWSIPKEVIQMKTYWALV